MFIYIMWFRVRYQTSYKIQSPFRSTITNQIIGIFKIRLSNLHSFLVSSSSIADLCCDQ